MPRKPPALNSYPQPETKDWPRIGRQRVFGRLVVLAYAGQDGYRHPYYLCLCECGEKRTVRHDRLTNGRQKSCGCLRADPEHRKSVRMQMDPKRRAEIALMGGRERAAAEPDELADLLAAARNAIAEKRDKRYASLWRRAQRLMTGDWSWPQIAIALHTSTSTLRRVKKTMEAQ